MEINFSDSPVKHCTNSIFLAGPTPRSKDITTWRIEACQILEKLGFDGVVYVPECSGWEPKNDYLTQVEWERQALTEAAVIVFWIPRNMKTMPGLTTNVEFGTYISKRIVYGRPDDSEKNRYLDWFYESKLKRKPLNDLEITLQTAINNCTVSRKVQSYLRRIRYNFFS